MQFFLKQHAVEKFVEHGGENFGYSQKSQNERELAPNSTISGKKTGSKEHYIWEENCLQSLWD